MAKVKISEFDVNPDNNTDINNINIAEGCAPSGINNAIRQLMSDLKEFQTGAGGDSITAVGVFSDTVGEKTSAAGVTVDGVLLKDSGITASGTNILSGTTIPSSKTLVVTTDIGTSVQAYDADTTKNDVANTFTANQIISVTDNTNAALRITQLGTGNALLVEDSSNPDSTPFVIDANGRIVSGRTSAITESGATPQFQIHTSTDFARARVGLFEWESNANPASTAFYKSRSGTTGVYGIVSNGDSLGALLFEGDDGTDFVRAASISASVDGTPGTNDMPGRLVFSTTADGASSPTERMRIDSSGNVAIGSTSPRNSRLYLENAGSSGAPQLMLVDSGDSAKQSEIRFDSGNLIFEYWDGSNRSERMRIDSSGQLGIGTSSPGYRLDVAAGDTTAGLGYAARLRSNSTAGAASLQFTNNGVTAQNAYITADDSQNLTLASGTGYTRLWTNGTERMRIDSSGNLLVGTTSSFGSYTRLAAQAPDGLVAIGAYRATTSTGYDIQQFRSDVGGTNSIKYAVYANGTAGAVSDINLKKNIESARGYLNDLQKIRVVKYNWITDTDESSKELGFIAQEVAEIFPAMVSETEDGTKILKKEIFIPMLIKAIQEQQAIINDLKARIETLESK